MRPLRPARTIALLSAALCALATASGVAADSSQGSAERGEAVYQDRCVMCHQLYGAGQGPSLKGVVGRPAASLPEFPYTAALKASGLVWSASRLDAFLSGPAELVPGTAMPMTVQDPSDRADLIAYLASLRPDGR